ncbi:MAG: hypothetical protein JRI54_09560 [Deltaproteobacteria bacterium]|nr:hypothetical protein [Deltaproteobacteria bacterium]
MAEVFAMGGVAGRNAASKAKEIGPPKILRHEIADERTRLESHSSQARQDQKNLRRSLKEVMWYKAGIIRSDRDLQEALTRIEELKSLSLKVPVANPGQLVRRLELENMLLLSEMVCRAALLRTESRGAHYRSDYPEEDNANWLQNIIIHQTDAKMRLESIPVSLDVVAIEEA